MTFLKISKAHQLFCLLLNIEQANLIFDKVYKHLYKKPQYMSYNIIQYTELNFLHFTYNLCCY